MRGEFLLQRGPFIACGVDLLKDHDLQVEFRGYTSGDSINLVIASRTSIDASIGLPSRSKEFQVVASDLYAL